jgi:hypothetical protein
MTRVLPGMLVLMPFISHAESVKNAEVQWMLCEPSVAAFQKKVHANMGNPESYQTYYMETQDLELMSRSAGIRIRVKGPQAKSSVKINYPDDLRLPWNELKGTDSKCEWDRYKQFQKVGCSMNNKSKDLMQSLSSDQERYLDRVAGFANFDELILLGPVQSQAWKWRQKDLDVDVSVEEINGPDGYNSIELSIRVPVADTDKIVYRVESWIIDKGLVLCATQGGKGETLIKALLRKQKLIVAR